MQQEKEDIFSRVKKAASHGGKRKGAGRPDLGKSHYNLTLTKSNVTKAKKREKNFSGLMDRLLAEWLA